MPPAQRFHPAMQAPHMPMGMPPQSGGGSSAAESYYTHPGAGGGGVSATMAKEVDTAILVEKEQTIQDLRETVEILELKIKKLEQLVRLKDQKIHAMNGRMQSAF